MSKIPKVDTAKEWKYRLLDNSSQFGFGDMAVKPIWGVILVLLMFLAVLYTILPSFVIGVLAVAGVLVVVAVLKKVWRNYTYHTLYVKPARKNEEHVVETSLVDRPFYKR